MKITGLVKSTAPLGVMVAPEGIEKFGVNAFTFEPAGTVTLMLLPSIVPDTPAIVIAVISVCVFGRTVTVT